MRRRSRALVASSLLASALLAAVAPAGPALAHAEVVSTYPQAGSTVHGTLTKVSVTFDEAVTLVPNALKVTTDAGIPIQLETPRLLDHGKVLLGRIQDHLAAGRYAVAWRAQADDGHLESSTFSFAIGAGTAPGAAMSPALPQPASPAEPLWPVLVAAGVALVGGVGAGLGVRRGLRLAALHASYSAGDASSHSERETFRLPT